MSCPMVWGLTLQIEACDRVVPAKCFSALMIDNTPKAEQHVQQLHLLVRYFSESRQQVVVEHLNSFNLGWATGDIIVECIEDALAELPRQGPLCFF